MVRRLLGFAQLELQDRHPDAVAMFSMGCGADQNPLPRRTVELCQKYGSMLAGAVDQALAGSLRPLPARIRTAFGVVDLPFGEQPTREELGERAKKNDYGAVGQAAPGESMRAPLARSYPRSRSGNSATNQLWTCWAAKSWSIMRSASRPVRPQTWVTGYANDVMSYIPRIASGRKAATGRGVQRLRAAGRALVRGFEDRIARLCRTAGGKVK